MKQTTIPFILLLGLSVSIPSPAADQDPAAPGQGRQIKVDENGTQIIIRTADEKRRRDAASSNRQSSPDASRGTDRAQQRRAVANEQADDDSRWWWPFD